jgi:hypothetical protein
LRLGAFVDKVAHDVELRHVLPGGKLRGGSRHQPSLAVDHVGHQAAQADLLQAADEVFQIDHGCDHAQKTPAYIMGELTSMTVRSDLPAHDSGCPL